MSWEKAIEFVLRYEGSTYENDPNDTGGETKYGISKKSYPKENIRDMTLDRAKEIYRQDYWNQLLGDKLPENLAACVFDAAVNQGLITAIKMLQVMLGVDVDGVVGPRTLKAAAGTTNYHVHLYLLHRARQYMKLKNVNYWGWNWGTRLIQFAEGFLK